MLALCGLFALYDAYSYIAPDLVRTSLTLAHAFLIVAVSLVSVRWGLSFLMGSIIFADDISRLDPYGGYEGLVNIMTLPVAGVAIANLVAVAVLGIGILFAVLRWSQGKGETRLTVVDGCVLAIALTYAVAAAHGYRSLIANFRGALNDLNLPLMTCGFYLLVRAHVRGVDALARFWNVLVLTAAAKAAVWFAFAFLGIGIEFGQTLRVGYDSGATLYVL